VTGAQHDDLRPDGQPEEIRLGLPGSAGDVTAPAAGGPGVPVRWCALLAVLLLGVTAGAGALLRHRRQASRTVTTVTYLHPDGLDPAGCPRGDNCVPQVGPGQPPRLPAALRGATLVTDSSLLDASTSRTIRTVQVLAAGRLTITVVAQCLAGALAVPARELPPEERSPAGAVAAGFVRPGRQPGCSLAVLASAPAGSALPLAALRQLADEPDAQLSQ